MRRGTHRPDSKTVDAMGDISEMIVNDPSNGLSARGRPIVPVTLASTLHSPDRTAEQQSTSSPVQVQQGRQAQNPESSPDAAQTTTL